MDIAFWNLPLYHATFRREPPHRPGERSRLSPGVFAVDDIDETLERLHKCGAQLAGEVVQYQNSFRLCYIRGPGTSHRARSGTQLNAV